MRTGGFWTKAKLEGPPLFNAVKGRGASRDELELEVQEREDDNGVTQVAIERTAETGQGVTLIRALLILTEQERLTVGDVPASGGG